MAQDKRERELEKERRRKLEELESQKELEQLRKGFDFKIRNPSMLESRLKYMRTPGKDMSVLKSPRKNKTRSVVPDIGPPESQTFFPFN